MDGFRLWLEAESWEKLKTTVGNKKLSIKDAVTAIFKRKFFPEEEEAKQLNRLVQKLGANRIVRTIDPRAAISVAQWMANGLVQTPEEHDADWDQYYKLRRLFKPYKKWTEKSRYPEQYQASYEAIRKILKSDPSKFKHYADLQDLTGSLLHFIEDRPLDDRDMALAKAKVEKRIQVGDETFTMYRIDTKEEAQQFVEAGAPRWCVLTFNFNQYHGPPYMPITARKGDGRQTFIGMFIPDHIVHDPANGLRDPANRDILEPNIIRKIKPMLLPYFDSTKLKPGAADRLMAMEGHKAESILELFNIPRNVAESLFRQALTRGNFGFVHTLLRNGQDPGKHKNALLAQAVRGASREGVELLLQLGADPNSVTGADEVTPLHWAMSLETGAERSEISDILLKAGGKINLPNKERETPLDWAGYAEDEALIKKMRSYAT